MEIIFVCWKIYALKVIQTCPRELILDMTNSRWFYSVVHGAYFSCMSCLQDFTFLNTNLTTLWMLNTAFWKSTFGVIIWVGRVGSGRVGNLAVRYWVGSVTENGLVDFSGLEVDRGTMLRATCSQSDTPQSLYGSEHKQVGSVEIRFE